MNKRVMYRLAFCTWMMILLACVYSSVFALAEEDSLSIYIDGEKLDPSVEPTIMNSRTFVPIRVIAEKWGATVGWNSKLQQVRITKDGTRMDLFIDRADAFVNKQTIYSDAPPVILEGRTMVPLRFVGELLGADIRYDAETRAVMVQLPEPEKPDPPEAGPVKPGELDPTLPTLQAIRFHDGQIVVEASEPVKPNVFYLTQPERIVIDVPGVNLGLNPAEAVFDPETYQSIIDVDTELVDAVRYAVHDAEKSLVRIVVDLKTRGAYTLTVEDEQPEFALDIRPGAYKVVIDAGHGGKDPGAKSVTGHREKEFNLSLALRVQKLLEEEPRLEPLMTRTTDVFLELQERTDFANSRNADAFLSIHANAFMRDTRGTETYYTYDYQQPFAAIIHEHLVAATGFPDRKLQQNRFFVTRNTSMPAALVEIGFLTNPTEEAQLLQAEFQDRVAQALVEGIKSYFQL